MNIIRRCATACAIALVAAAVTLPAGPASGQLIRTKISLTDFKRAYGFASIQRVFDLNKGDGVSLWMTKRDRNGNKINWSDPNRANVDGSKSFIWFRADAAKLAAVFELLDAMRIKARIRTPSGPTFVAFSDCDLGGTSSAGVKSVSCGGGPVVSPH